MANRISGLFSKGKPGTHDSPGIVATADDSYRCSGLLLTTMTMLYPDDLKAAELEAITNLRTKEIKEASEAILGFMNESLLTAFIEKLSHADPAAAQYLANARAARAATTPH